MLALLSLGGNVGDLRATMDAAVAALGGLPGTIVTARSPAYRSAPDGPVADQPPFVNLAVEISTALDISALSAACRDIEARLGRDRTAEIPWGPRPIDIDVVAVGRSRTDMSPPSGTFDERAFVIVPLADIAADAVVGGRPVGERAAGADRTELQRLDWLPA